MQNRLLMVPLAQNSLGTLPWLIAAKRIAVHPISIRTRDQTVGFPLFHAIGESELFGSSPAGVTTRTAQ